MKRYRQTNNQIIEWKLAFYILAGLYTVGVVVFYFFYSITHFSMRRSELFAKFWYLLAPLAVFAIIYKLKNRRK